MCVLYNRLIGITIDMIFFEHVYTLDVKGLNKSKIFAPSARSHLHFRGITLKHTDQRYIFNIAMLVWIRTLI